MLIDGEDIINNLHRNNNDEEDDDDDTSKEDLFGRWYIYNLFCE